MTKVFISQPMKDKTNEEIIAEREEAKKYLDENYDDYEIIDSFIEDLPHNAKPVFFLAMSIQYLSQADLAIFCKGWEDARGCKIEHQVCESYGIDIKEMD